MLKQHPTPSTEEYSNFKAAMDGVTKEYGDVMATRIELGVASYKFEPLLAQSRQQMEDLCEAHSAALACGKACVMQGDAAGKFQHKKVEEVFSSMEEKQKMLKVYGYAEPDNLAAAEGNLKAWTAVEYPKVCHITDFLPKDAKDKIKTWEQKGEERANQSATKAKAIDPKKFVNIKPKKCEVRVSVPRDCGGWKLTDKYISSGTCVWDWAVGEVRLVFHNDGGSYSNVVQLKSTSQPPVYLVVGSSNPNCGGNKTRAYFGYRPEPAKTVYDKMDSWGEIHQGPELEPLLEKGFMEDKYKDPGFFHYECPKKSVKNLRT